ncbi:MAG TPA: DedA family protein [Castellaniella sp.]|uniref:DedA family protein n=1 Tax=Castellaniella sp. TaxID=1955812 RepID=UPI002F0D37B7
MFGEFQVWLNHLYGTLGYGEIFLLMTLESCLFPVPAELVMIPAGYLASAGRLDPTLAVAAGAGGSLLGASINYVLGRTLGRAFLLRYGRFLLIDPPHYHQAERLFLRNASLATFVGRLLPVIRHLISLPAGVFGMNKAHFVLWTVAGAALLCAIELALGYYLGPPAVKMMRGYSHEVGIVVILLVAGWLVWFLRRRRA